MLSYALLYMLPLFVAVAMLALLSRSKRMAFMLSSLMLVAETAIAAHLVLVGADIVLFGAFHIYAFSALFAALFSFVLLLVNILTYRYSADYSDDLFMLGLVLGGAVIVPAATSLLMLLVSLELVAVPMAFTMLLAGRHRAEAATKFLILGAVSIAAFSFAMVLIFPYDAQLGVSLLGSNAGIAGSALIMLALVLFVLALGFGAEIFPFDLWVPDVYDGAPSYAVAALASVNKGVAFVVLLELLFVVFAAQKAMFSSMAMLLSVLTMFFGNLIALTQKSVKRMLAYSSISQAGYILIGFAAASQFGIEASIFQLIAHSFMIVGAFAIVLWLESVNLKTVSDYGGLSRRNRFAAFSLTLIMLSMAGIPPLMGFVGKFLLFSSAIDSGALLLAALGILSSLISVLCYAKVISAMYSATDHAKLRTDRAVAVVAVVALAIVVVFGIYPQPVITAAQLASKALLGI
jgi:NADH-quinone oxidoreductase subunit N